MQHTPEPTIARHGIAITTTFAAAAADEDEGEDYDEDEEDESEDVAPQPQQQPQQVRAVLLPSACFGCVRLACRLRSSRRPCRCCCCGHLLSCSCHCCCSQMCCVDPQRGKRPVLLTPQPPAGSAKRQKGVDGDAKPAPASAPAKTKGVLRPLSSCPDHPLP